MFSSSPLTRCHLLELAVDHPTRTFVSHERMQAQEEKRTRAWRLRMTIKLFKNSSARSCKVDMERLVPCSLVAYPYVIIRAVGVSCGKKSFSHSLLDFKDHDPIA
jgi:hypothetical protein